MLRLRLKRVGRKSSPSYRIVIIKNLAWRNGRPIEEVGYYNPLTKHLSYDTERIRYWLKIGVKPTLTVLSPAPATESRFLTFYTALL